MKNIAPKLKIVALALILGLGTLGTVLVASQSKAQPEEAPPVTIPPKTEVMFETEEVSVLKENGEQLYFTVELAKTGAQKSQGLMFRTEMAENAGMLFLFNSPSKLSFWMKNTLIPLDMLFLHADGTIHHIHHNANPQDTTSITSKYDSKAVLELNGGTADKMGIKEGDQVIHPFFKNAGVDPEKLQ